MNEKFYHTNRVDCSKRYSLSIFSRTRECDFTHVAISQEQGEHNRCVYLFNYLVLYSKTVLVHLKYFFDIYNIIYVL